LFSCLQFTLSTNVFYLLCGGCIAAWANLLAHWWACRRAARSVQLRRRTAAATVISDTDGMDAAAAAEHGLETPLFSLLQQYEHTAAACYRVEVAGCARQHVVNMSPSNGSVGVVMLQ